MRKTSGAILLRAILVAFVLAAAYMSALAVDWPAPPDKWWESLSPGDTATFEIAVDTEPPTKMKVVIKVLDVKGSKITVSTKTTTDGKPMPERTETLDAKGRNLKSSLPEYAKVTKFGEKGFKAGDKTFICTEYLVRTYDTSTSICYSPELPLVFNDGNVTIETKAGGITSTMTLKEYSGKKLEIPKSLEN